MIETSRPAARSLGEVAYADSVIGQISRNNHKKLVKKVGDADLSGFHHLLGKADVSVICEFLVYGNRMTRSCLRMCIQAQGMELVPEYRPRLKVGLDKPSAERDSACGILPAVIWCVACIFRVFSKKLSMRSWVEITPRVLPYRYGAAPSKVLFGPMIRSSRISLAPAKPNLLQKRSIISDWILRVKNLSD